MQAIASDPPQVSPPPGRVELRYALSGFSEDWVIPEIEVPEAPWHDRCLELVRALLDAWVAGGQRDAAVYRDIALLARRELPRVGFNPDVCLVEPAPPLAAEIQSYRLWEHAAPRFCFEAVSPNHPYKDYVIVPDKCAVTGVGELAVFDPLLKGPQAQGGPWLLQLWRRTAEGAFERVFAGNSPVRSEVLGAWLLPNAAGRRVRIAGAPNGDEPWLTFEERALEREQRAIEREEQARVREEAALRRVAELEAALGRK